MVRVSTSVDIKCKEFNSVMEHLEPLHAQKKLFALIIIDWPAHLRHSFYKVRLFIMVQRDYAKLLKKLTCSRSL